MLVSTLHTSIHLCVPHIVSTSNKERYCSFASVLVPPKQPRKATELKINALKLIKSTGNT